MQVFVNDNEIPVDLQGERTASDVVRGLHDWLQKEGFGATSISVNGTEVLSKSGWDDFGVADIAEVRISGGRLIPLRRSCLELVEIWSQRFHETLEAHGEAKGSISNVMKAIGDYAELDGAFNFLSSYDPSPMRLIERETRINLDRSIASCINDDGLFNAQNIPALAGSVYGLMIICRDRIKEIDHPISEAHTTALLAEGLLGDLSSVGTLLQVGQEKEAFSKIFTFSEVLTKLLRLFWIMTEQGDDKGTLQDVPDLRAWNDEAQQCLSQILEAMHAGDSVLIGDLLEYELPPLVERLVAMVPATEA